MNASSPFNLSDWAVAIWQDHTVALFIIALLILILAALIVYLAVTRRKLRLTNNILNKMSLAVEYSPLSIMMTDLSGALEYVNPCFTELTGYSRDEAIGQNPRFLNSEVTPPDKHRDLWDTILAGRVWHGEFCNRKKSGELYWENAAIAPVMDKNGVITNFVAIKENITEHKRADEALLASEQKFRAIADYTSGWESWVDPDGKVIWVNPGVETITGYTPQEYILMPSRFERIIAEQDRNMVLSSFQDALNFRSLVQDLRARICCKDGTTRWVSISCQPINGLNGEYLGVRSSIRDITLRKVAEVALQAAKEHAENIIAITNDIVIAMDPTGIIRSFNQAAEKITGYSAHELEDRNWFEVLTPRDRYPEAWREFEQHYSKGGLPQRIESPILTKSGEERIIVWHNSAVAEADKIIGTVSFGVDITERKRAEVELSEYQEQLRSLASELSLAEERERRRIAAGIHDNVVQNLALCKIKLESLLKDGQISGEFQHDIAATRDILNAVIIDSRDLIFDLSPPLLYEVGLVPAVQSLLERLGKEHGFRVGVSAHVTLPHFPEDLRVSIYQMIRELLINIVKYASASEVNIAFVARYNHVVILVDDDGVGFEPVLPKNSGYGLFSIKQRLRQIGGDLLVHSTIGSGSSVQIKLPLLISKEG